MIWVKIAHFRLKWGHFRLKTCKKTVVWRIFTENECMMSQILPVQVWFIIYESLLVNVHFWVKVHFSSSNWVGATTTWRRRRFLTEIEFWAGMSILSFGESRSSVRPWHPRDYSKHMSRDDVINTSDADHMILVYNHMTNPSNFTMWKFLKFWSKISFWSPKITKKVDFFPNILGKIDFFAELKFSWSFFG